MKHFLRALTGASLLLCSAMIRPDSYSDTVSLFKNAGESAAFFTNCYGYAVFPAIGQAGLAVGGADGRGRVYEHGKYVGDTSMNQLSVGYQLGGQAYSQIIFFEDQRAFKEFTKGDFEFGADLNAVAITAAAGGGVGTAGASADARGGMGDSEAPGRSRQGRAGF